MRYCKPSDFDSETRELLYTAFARKPNEHGLSVRRLQFFLAPDRESAVDCVRQEFVRAPYGLRSSGRFVVLGVCEAKAAASGIGYEITIVFTPKPSYPSHTSIFGLPPDSPGDRREQVRVAVAFLRLITSDDTYQAVPT